MGFGALALAGAIVVAISGHDLGAGTATVGSAGAASCHPSSSLVCVGQSDSAHSVDVRLGERLQVTFNTVSLTWSNLRQVGPPLLRVTKRPTTSAHQFTETFTPVSVGHTALQATASPRCSPNQACPEFILLWQVQIIVRR
jgi:hypothetical protein